MERGTQGESPPYSTFLNWQVLYHGDASSGMRVVHLGQSTCHAISGRGDKSTRRGQLLSFHGKPGNTSGFCRKFRQEISSKSRLMRCICTKLDHQHERKRSDPRSALCWHDSANHCRANSAHIRQSIPDAGLGFQVKVLKIKFFPVRSAAEWWGTDPTTSQKCEAVPRRARI